MNPSERASRKIDQMEHRIKIPFKNCYREIGYNKIDVSGLTKDRLKELYREKGYKKTPDISETSDSFTIHYENKPPVILDKTTGVISTSGNWDSKYANLQIEKVIHILRFDGRIKKEDYTMYTRNYHRKIEFIEGDGGNGNKTGNTV